MFGSIGFALNQAGIDAAYEPGTNIKNNGQQGNHFLLAATHR